MKSSRILKIIRDSIIGSVNKALLASLLLLSAAAHAAGVNVLIIGSERDTSQNVGGVRNSEAFSGSGIKTQLENILGGAGLGTVNVQYEDRSTTYTTSTNLATWFFWSAESAGPDRWANLRGQGGTDWDYVVLIGDPYTIEYMPGLYAHGVAKVAEEVSKGEAETILLMPWPGANSDRTVAHYKEVVYRAGRSGGHKVAPAALAWEAANSPATGNTHPNNDGAFICAASIYSRIYGQSAAAVSNYNDALANTVHNTVTANVGQPQYSGVFSFQSPFRGFWDRNRSINFGTSAGGSSTENGNADKTGQAVRRTGANTGGGNSYHNGRDTWNTSGEKDYRNKGYDKNAFGYVYQYQTKTIDVQSRSTDEEIYLANRMIDESDTFTIIPWRYIMADAWKQDNSVYVSGDNEHLSGPIQHGLATYNYTLISGRCPLSPKPDPVTDVWLGTMAGYQMAWHAITCQSRAPGFQAKPTSATVGFQYPELMTVRFFLPPKEDVTVSIACTSSDISLSQQTLTFTPANYDQPQQVELLAKAGAVVGASFTVNISTSSNDEVYNGLFDTWSYKVNTKPEANPQSISVYKDEIVATTLTASDGNGEALTYRIGTPPENGTVTLDGVVAAYEPNPGYTGPDSFTFIVTDGSDDSEPATVSITVKTKELYGSNLLVNGSAELSPITDYGWVNKVGSWDQFAFTVDGSYAFMNGADVKTAELYQDVDVSAYADRIAVGDQAFNITGHVFSRKGDDSRVYVRFLDATGTQLSQYDSGVASNSYPGDAITADLVAPVGTATVRVLFHSVDGGDKGQRGQGLFDAFSLSAIQPPGNALPSADAGPDQIVADDDDNGSEAVTLDGSGSSDFDGTIASYVWTERGVEIATGAAPTVSLELGEHIITLTVTDDEGATGTDTVTIQVDGPNALPAVDAGPDQAATLTEGSGGGEPVAGAYFEWDAAQDTGGNNLWTNTGAGSYDWQFTGNVTPSAVNDTRFNVLSLAYDFPAAKSQSQATLENSISSIDSATWEFVLRTDATASDGIIMESGGTVDGIQIWIENGFLKAEARDGSAPTTVSYQLSEDDKTRFIHVVFVVDMESNLTKLYVDGEEPVTAEWSGADWCGSNNAGLGTVGDIAPTGSPEDFTGQIALIRCYENKAFSAAEVATNFNALSSGPSASVIFDSASVTDANAGQTLSAQWSVISQPAGSTVSFDDPTLVNATATFDTIGEYTLKLTGSDPYQAVEDTVIVTVSGSFALWIAMHDVGDQAGFSQDADGDGISNGLESYFGTDPGSASSGVGAGILNHDPSTDTTTFTFSHPLNSNPATNISAGYRWSPNLGSFHANGASDGSTTVTFSQGTPVDGWVTVTATITGAVPARMFVDIQVNQL